MRRTIICVTRDDKHRVIRVHTRHTDQLGQTTNQTWSAQNIFENQDELEMITDYNGELVNTGRFDFYAQTTYTDGTMYVRARQDDEDGVFFIREDIGDESSPHVTITSPSCSELIKS